MDFICESFIFLEDENEFIIFICIVLLEIFCKKKKYNKIEIYFFFSIYCMYEDIMMFYMV